MKNKIFFKITEEDKNKIISAVKSVEKETASEILPVIVQKSGSYKSNIFFTSIFLTLIISITTIIFNVINIFEYYTGVNNLYLFLFFQIFTFTVLFLLFNCLPQFFRLFLFKFIMTKKVEESAIKSFYNDGVYKTKDKTGILIYISIFEKSIVVLADEGINSKIQKGYWDEIVAIIKLGFKNNKPIDSIVEAILSCKNTVSINFPIKSDDTNELEDLIVK